MKTTGQEMVKEIATTTATKAIEKVLVITPVLQKTDYILFQIRYKESPEIHVLTEDFKEHWLRTKQEIKEKGRALDDRVKQFQLEYEKTKEETERFRERFKNEFVLDTSNGGK